MGMRSISMTRSDEKRPGCVSSHELPRHLLQPFKSIGAERGIETVLRRNNHMAQPLALAMVFEQKRMNIDGRLASDDTVNVPEERNHPIMGRHFVATAAVATITMRDQTPRFPRRGLDGNDRLHRRL